MSTLGQKYVKELCKALGTAEMVLHWDHRRCPICREGPFEAIGTMVDHVTGHPERVSLNVAPKDGCWVVLVEPHEQHRRKNKQGKTKPLPPTLQGLPTIRRQMKALGVDENWKDALSE